MPLLLLFPLSLPLLPLHCSSFQGYCRSFRIDYRSFHVKCHSFTIDYDSLSIVTVTPSPFITSFHHHSNASSFPPVIPPLFFFALNRPTKRSMAKPAATPKANRLPTYSKTRVPDLVARLVERGLPHTGTRADLVERLREDDRKKAARIEPPSDGVGEPTGASSTLYHSAYHGTALDPDGNFSHFVRTIDNSHQRRGYWKFASVEDDRRAHARGFSTPEEVLLEQDRSLDSFDHIILRWVPGSENASPRGILSGTARLHLMTMYELRMLLEQPLSLRGQVPVYPIHQDPRLEQYWKAKANLQELNVSKGPIIETASTAPPLPTPKPLSHHRSTPSEPPSQQSTVACTQQETNTQDTCGTSICTNDLSLRLPAQSTASPLTSPPQTTGPPTPNETANISNTRPTDSQVDDEIPDEPSSVYWDPKGDLGTPLVFELQSLDDDEVSTNVSVPSNETYLEGLSDLLLFLPPPHTLETSLPSTHDTSQHVRQSSPGRPLSPLPLSNPVQSAPLSLQPHVQTSDAEFSQRNCFEQIEKDFAVHDVEHCPSSTDTAGITAPDTVVQSKPTSAPDCIKPSGDHTIGHEDLVSIGTSTPSAVPGDMTVSPLDVLDKGLHGLDWQTETRAPQAAIPHCAQTDSPKRRQDAYLDIPCMDCGLEEVEGHTPDCHINSELPLLSPTGHIPSLTQSIGMFFSKNPTILDYRRLADAVERFDPGPWTTHFNPFPTPPPEEPEAQISGMADIIRNEDSYKNDVDLHGLPDSVMILLWAFKTSPGIEVFTE